MEERIEIINLLIKEIASKGRFFFKHDDKVAYIFLKNGRLYMKNEYNDSDMSLSQKYMYPPKKWHHGQTLWVLTLWFKGFIKHGIKLEKGGLNNPHWGYSSEDMMAIQTRAKQLGYLL